MFEVLYCALVLLGRGSRGERAEVAALAGFRIFLARIKSVLAGTKFANHDDSSMDRSHERAGLDDTAEGTTVLRQQKLCPWALLVRDGRKQGLKLHRLDQVVVESGLARALAVLRLTVP
jgi:hypothetical protein